MTNPPSTDLLVTDPRRHRSCSSPICSSPDLLVTAARDAAAFAYAPYSRFAVGAALRLTDGAIVTGANVENASYGLSLCAETVALARVANLGRLADVVAVAVIAPGTTAPVYPCGRCRQMLNEAAALGGRDIDIVCAGTGGRRASPVIGAAAARLWSRQPSADRRPDIGQASAPAVEQVVAKLRRVGRIVADRDRGADRRQIEQVARERGRKPDAAVRRGKARIVPGVECDPVPTSAAA